VSAGGVIIEALPDITEDQVFMLEDIISSFKDISSVLRDNGAEGIMDFYFSHLEYQSLESDLITLECKCSKERMDALILSLGKQETDDILIKNGNIEIFCEFCSKKYVYTKDDIFNLFEGVKYGKTV